MRITFNQTVNLLRSGTLVAIPTETVYGLAAWIHALGAVEKIYQIKGRPQNNPLIMHVADVDQIVHYASSLPADFFLLARKFWPGPLTIILPIKKELVPDIVRADLATCAFRIPSHPVTLELLKHIFPLVAPSANRSGTPSATRAHHVEADFGEQFPILEGDGSDCGVESTIIVENEGRWCIVRQGAISQEELGVVLGYLPEKKDTPSVKPLCPGQLLRHYAPQCKLILSSADLSHQQGTVIGFSDRKYPNASKIFHLSTLSDPKKAAFSLYDILRTLDLEGIHEVHVDMSFPEIGLWQTVRERLIRASTK